MNCAEPHSPKRTPSAAARAANTDASANANASRVSAVDINPQFVVIRDFSELEATIRAIRSGPVPIRSTVYDVPHCQHAAPPHGDGGGGSGSSASRTVNGSNEVANATSNVASGIPRTVTASRGSTTDVATPHTTHNQADASSGRHSSPLHGSLSGPSPLRRSAESTASVATLSSPLRHSAASPVFPPSTSLTTTGRDLHAGTSPLFPTLQPPQHPRSSSQVNGHSTRSSRPGGARKVLCIWDVDDTLVASGAAGVRQNVMFSASELVPLFKSMPNARHLLLSQGSIDDVFYPNRGRLRFLQKFFVPNGSGDGNGPGSASSGANEDDRASLASSVSTEARAREKKRTSASSSSSIFSCGGTKEKTPAKDEVTAFEKGTVVVRLSTVRGSAEAPHETDFMYHRNVKPTLHGKSSRDQIRWLVLRPTTWGITLATLNSLFTPSVNTACVDGKIFHKMDVAWSLAKSGNWDSVFFIDNNLSEIGVVTFGMNMNDVLELQHTHQVYKFFHAEFLLLAASAKIRQLEKQHGRDVTVPAGATTTASPAPQPSSPTKSNHTSPDGKEVTVTHDEAVDVKAREERSGLPAGKPRENAQGSSTEPLLTSHPRTVEAATSDHGTGQHVDAPYGSTTADATTTPPVQSSSPQTSTFGAGGRCRQVDLVVAHLHMETAKYRQLLLGNRSGTDMGTRNSDIARNSGQPTFNGDAFLTDDQYEAVLALFRMEESMMYQLMDEEMRCNGYVDMADQRKFSPQVRFVHMPVYRRPLTIPHMRAFYEAIGQEIETRVVQPLLKGGGLIRGASVIRGDAHILCTNLLRAGPFLDPSVQGGVALELFMVYTAEGNVEKVSGEYVHRAVQKLLHGPSAKDGKKKAKT